MAMPMNEQICLSEISDALAILEKMDNANLLLFRKELDRMFKNAKQREGQSMAHDGRSGDSVSPVLLGAKFVFRTELIFGAEYANSRKPPFEGQTLSVVGFEPRYINNVVVQDPSGSRSLLPLDFVQRGLSRSPVQEDHTEDLPATLNDTLNFVAHANSAELDALVEHLREARKGLDVNAAARLKIGDLVVRDRYEGREELKGSITKIFAGRVIIRTFDGAPNLISLPAGSVRIAQGTT